MANERIPNDPYDPYRSGLSDDNFGRPQRFDTELQPDPELGDGRASTAKFVLLAVGLAVLLGAVFYGLNNTSVKEAQIPPPAQTARTQNAQPGMTTGSATNSAMPPHAVPANPPADNNDNK